MFSSPTPEEIQKILEHEIGITVERLPRSARKQPLAGHKEIMSAGGTLYDSAIHYAMFAVSQMRDPKMISRVADACQRISDRATLSESLKVVEILREIADDVKSIRH